MQGKYKITGIQEVKDLLNQIRDNVQNVSSFLKNAGIVVVESVLKNFMAGGRPDAWEPLKESTLERRARGKSDYNVFKSGPKKGRWTKATAEKYILAGAQPLRDTGILMASIGNPGGDGIFEMVENGLAVGTGVKCGWFHQWGTKWMPARPFMMVQEADADTIARMAADHAMKGTA